MPSSNLTDFNSSKPTSTFTWLSILKFNNKKDPSIYHFRDIVYLK